MRIVDRKTFLAMPAGTIFQKYAPCYFGSIEIKDATSEPNDFYTVCSMDQPYFAAVSDSGEWMLHCDRIATGEASGPLDFEIISRDGLFDDDQLFAIWERADVEALINRIGKALADGYKD